MMKSSNGITLPVLSGVALALWLIACTALAYQGEYFFMIAWDGVRYDQLDSYTAPHLLGEIKDHGVWLPHLYNAWHTWTSPGHPNFHTGNPNFHPNTGRFWKLSHYYPSLMETYLKEPDLVDEDTTWAWVFGNCPNDSDWGRSRHPGYNDTYVASRKFKFAKSDGKLFDEVILPTLETYHPGIFWVDFHEVDYRGHRIQTPEDSLKYRDAIRRADSLLALIIQYIDTSSVYSGKTNVFITTDHGRHSEGILTGLKDHGCDCDGCRHVFGCLWGPDFKDGLVDSSYYYQTDIAHVIGHVMGLRAPHTRTRTLVDNWIDGYKGMRPWRYKPAGSIRVSQSGLPCSSPDVVRSHYDEVHTIWSENQRQIIYRRRDTEWRDPVVMTTAADDELLREPRISCYGDDVTAIWQRYRTNNHGFYSWYVETTSSTDGGQTWSEIVTDAFGDAAVMTSDVVVGKNGASTYTVVGGVYTAFEGSRDSVGVVSIRRSQTPGTWSEKGRYPENTTYQANYINLDCFGSVCIAVCQAFDRPDQNSEIIATWSQDNGITWRKSWLSVTRDGGGSHYMHQYYPSGLVAFTP
jgi:hypothetical protein